MKKIILTLLLFILFMPTSSHAGLNLISDEESELFLTKITRPIFNAANINFDRSYVYIVNDDSLNAFVGDENRLFINTGTIVKADNVDELRGVIAHESGHILGGHILRGKIKSQELNYMSLGSMLMAGAAMAASGRADVGMALMLGSQSSLISHYTAYRVQEERSADESAITILDEIGKSPQGMRDFMKKIQHQNELSGVEETPYFRTHPVTTERITFMEEAVKKSKYKPSNQDQDMFLRVRAKLIGFLYEPKKVMSIYPETDKSIPARYARSIANYRSQKLKTAMNELNALIKLEPANPFFYELKAQMYFENGNMKTAKKYYKKALELFPNSEILKQSLVHATLEDQPNEADLRQAINILNQSLIRLDSPYSWLMLSRAYDMLNDKANSLYASAEYSYRLGEYDTALKQAKQAQKSNPSPALDLKINDLTDRLNDIIKEKKNFSR